MCDGNGRRGLGWAMAVLANGLRDLPRYGLLPLQCWIYGSEAEVRALIARIDPDCDVIYLDGVRLLRLLEGLRRRFPDKWIVVDLDDLMSRRMRALLALREPLVPGYLGARLPAPLRRLAGGIAGRLVARFEALTLPRAEARICELADAVVLLSPSDLAELPAGGRARRVAITPTVSHRPHASARLKPGPIRCIFIGSDALTQNRLTIDFLLDVWRRFELPLDLVLFGQQERRLSLPPRVRLEGYVESLDEVYDGRSVLITPSFLRGGIKTKVLEAMSYGTPVIGNSTSFEGVPISGYPLQVEGEEALVSLLRDLGSKRAVLEAAARIGLDHVREHHGAQRFARDWSNVLCLPAEKS